MNIVVILQDKLNKEKPKYMKQIARYVKKIAKKHAREESSLENSVPSTSAH